MTGGKDAALSERMAAYYDELKWLYSEIFQNDEQAFDYFLSVLRGFGDRQAPPQTERADGQSVWSGGTGRPGILMDADPAGKDPEEIIRELDEAVLRGVNCICLTSQAAVFDQENFRAFVRACHARGIGVCADYVIERTEQRNPTVFNDMLSGFLTLCQSGVDIVRLQNYTHIRRTSGNGPWDWAEIHTPVRMMRMAVEIVSPGTLLLGELAMDPQGAGAGFGTQDKPEAHLIFNMTETASLWHTVATRDVRLLRHELEMAHDLPKQSAFVNALRGKSGVEWALDYGFLQHLETDEATHRKFLNDYYTGAWAGSPARGRALPDGRGVCATAAQLCGLAAGAGTHGRAEDDAERLFVMLHAFLFTMTGIPALYREEELPPAVGERIDRLLRLRAAHRVFESEADVWALETWNDHVLGVGRYCRGEKLLALFNFSDHSEIAWIDEAEPYTDLLTDAFREAKAVELMPREFVWLLTTFG